MDKGPSAQDEIALVNHLHQVVCDGLLGRNLIEVVGEEPKRRIFAGVLFPSDEYVRRLPNENTLNVDPQPQYLSIARNVNQGIEFLVHPTNGSISILLSGVISLYIRVFPTYQEQVTYLEHLMKQGSTDADVSHVVEYDETDANKSETNSNNEDENGDEDAIPEHQKGLVLLEKYRRVDVKFDGVRVNVDCNAVASQTIDLLESIIKSVSICEAWDDVFRVRPELIHHTGAVPMERVPRNEVDFSTYIEQLKSENVAFPSWNASINIDPREYRDRQGQILNRISVTLINVTPTSPPNSREPLTGHPSEFFDCQLSVTLIDGQHVPYEFDGAPNDYRTDKKFDARGVNCVGVRDQSSSAVVLRTETIPSFFQTHYRTREDYAVLFNDLTAPAKVIISLSKISRDMRAYRDTWAIFIRNGGDSDQPLRTEDEVGSCKKDLEEFEAEITAFDLGVYALVRDSRLMLAFTMMNEVF
ncbi:MAG: helicase-related protein, partial [Bacilli bacterium]